MQLALQEKQREETHTDPPGSAAAETLPAAALPTNQLRVDKHIVHPASGELGCLDVAELRERFLQVRVALALDFALVRLLAVAREDPLRHIEPFRYLADGGEALAIEEGVVLVVDEHLRRAGARPGGSEGEITALVRDLHRVVLQAVVAHRLVLRRVPGEAKLDDEVRDDAKEARVVPNFIVQFGLEPLDAERRPVRPELDLDV